MSRESRRFPLPPLPARRDPVPVPAAGGSPGPHSPVQTPILRLAGEPKSQKSPLWWSQGSRSVQSSPSCLAHTRQQPQPSSTRETPAGQVGPGPAPHWHCPLHSWPRASCQYRGGQREGEREGASEPPPGPPGWGRRGGAAGGSTYRAEESEQQGYGQRGEGAGDHPAAVSGLWVARRRRRRAGSGVGLPGSEGSRELPAGRISSAARTGLRRAVGAVPEGGCWVLCVSALLRSAPSECSGRVAV